MTSPSVVLRYRADDDPGQPTTAVVEVIDESLRTYTHLPVDAGRTVVSLPRPGRYLARGWTPAGRPIGAEWHTEDEDEVVIVPAAPAPRPPERGQAVRWVSLWYRTDTRWIPMTGMGEPGSAGWTDLPVPAGAPVAVQLGDDDGPTSTVLTMSDEDVIVSTVTAGSGQPAIAGDDLAAALLGYLHQGDLRSAAVLATRRTGQTAIRAGIAEVALAYVRFLTAADVGSLPVGELVRRLPRSPDAHVLAAWQELRSPEPDSRTARAALLRAHKLGGPVVAAGVRLLADGLALLSRDGRGLPNRPAAAALAQVRRYQRVLCDAALTTYSSLTPNVPACVVSAPVPAHELQWHRVPIGGGHHGEAEFPQYPGEIRSPLSPGVGPVPFRRAERRAGELGTGPRRSANQETKVRRQVFAALDSVGAGPEAYGRAGEAAGWLAHSARSLPWAEGAWLTRRGPDRHPAIRGHRRGAGSGRWRRTTALPARWKHCRPARPADHDGRNRERARTQDSSAVCRYRPGDRSGDDGSG